MGLRVSGTKDGLSGKVVDCKVSAGAISSGLGGSRGRGFMLERRSGDGNGEVDGGDVGRTSSVLLGGADSGSVFVSDRSEPAYSVTDAMEGVLREEIDRCPDSSRTRN